jgi:hypothetical protein
MLDLAHVARVEGTNADLCKGPWLVAPAFGVEGDNNHVLGKGGASARFSRPRQRRKIAASSLMFLRYDWSCPISAGGGEGDAEP